MKYPINEESFPNSLKRFLSYTQIDTSSDPHSQTTPTSPAQLVLSRQLIKELEDLGVTDISLDEFGVAIAHIPATPGYENAPKIGFVAHVDTSPEAAGGPVKWQIAQYDGTPIVLSEEKNITLNETQFPELGILKGHKIVCTDGNTLLGADNKAGVAVVMGIAEYFMTHPEVPHAAIRIAFTPDEELGCGVNSFDIKRFDADYAYTFDGAEEGRFETETFNGSKADVYFTGVSVHPGTAKDKLINALRMASEFVCELWPEESPERTDGRQGFFHPKDIRGGVESASVGLIIRDHDLDILEERKARLLALVEDFNQRYPGRVRVEMKDSYKNMGVYIAERPIVVELARKAFEEVGVKINETVIRGGTDGSRISEMGCPCPNIFTGGYNFHGVQEYLDVLGFMRSQAVGITLVKLSAQVPPLTK